MHPIPKLMRPLTLLVWTAVVGITGCASTASNTLAIQKPNKQFEVTGQGKTQIIAQNNALRAAQETCRRRQVIVTQTDHQDMGIGSDPIGGVIQRAGYIVGAVTGRHVDFSQDTDHQVTLNFYCQ